MSKAWKIPTEDKIKELRENLRIPIRLQIKRDCLKPYLISEKFYYLMRNFDSDQIEFPEPKEIKYGFTTLWIRLKDVTDFFSIYDFMARISLNETIDVDSPRKAEINWFVQLGRGSEDLIGYRLESILIPNCLTIYYTNREYLSVYQKEKLIRLKSVEGRLDTDVETKAKELISRLKHKMSVSGSRKIVVKYCKELVFLYAIRGCIKLDSNILEIIEEIRRFYGE